MAPFNSVHLAILIIRYVFLMTSALRSLRKFITDDVIT